MSIGERILEQLKRDKGFQLQASLGQIPGVIPVHKFGRDDAIDSTESTVINGSGVTDAAIFPALGAGTRVRVKAGGHASDTALGVGARDVYIQGIKDGDRTLITEKLATAGANASEWTSNDFLRVFRFWVGESGSTGYNVGAITLETEGPADISVINATRGQSQIGFYTVPAGYSFALATNAVRAETGKTPTVRFYQRRASLDGTTLYSRRLVQEWPAQVGSANEEHLTWELYPQYTDLYYTGYVSTSTARVDVEFEGYLINNDYFDEDAVFAIALS